MQSDPAKPWTKAKTGFLFLSLVTAVLAIFSAVLMTEPGQSLNLPKAWIFAYHANKWLAIVVLLALLASMWVLNLRHGFVRTRWMVLASGGVFVCIIAANFLLVALFPTYQYDAKYVSVAEADEGLDDDEIVYVIDLNDEVRAFPQDHMWIPHIAGADFGGEKVVMTFCALSNLPVVIGQDIGTRGETDLGVLIQVHNNLVMVERNSGELIQQITAETQFSGQQLKTYPNDMMTWGSFKQLYPDAEVFSYHFNRPLDAFLTAIFQVPIEKQFSEDHGAIFPTLDLKDTRLPNKEQVWGLKLGDKQAAIARSFVEKNPVYEFEFAGRPMVLVHDQQHDIVALFDRTLDGKVISVSEIDRRGNTPEGTLEQIPLHNGVFWMIWAHWFPDTEVYS